MSQPLIDLQHISKSFDGEMVLDDLNLSIKENSFVTLLGPSGCGKSTTLRILGGFTPPDKGNVIFDGQDITKLPPNKRQLNTVFQKYALFPHMTIAENMALADNKGKAFNLRPGTNKQRLEFYRESLRSLGLGLEDKMDVKVGVLSGGQRQAMALLMSTMTPIEFLILDEHTAALDPKTAETIMELTDKVVREKNLTTIMVTHNLRFAVEYGNRLLMMHQGHAVIDKAGEEKEATTIDHILKKFNEISIECGN